MPRHGRVRSLCSIRRRPDFRFRFPSVLAYRAAVPASAVPERVLERPRRVEHPPLHLEARVVPRLHALASHP